MGNLNCQTQSFDLPTCSGYMHPQEVQTLGDLDYPQKQSYKQYKKSESFLSTAETDITKKTLKSSIADMNSFDKFSPNKFGRLDKRSYSTSLKAVSQKENQDSISNMNARKQVNLNNQLPPTTTSLPNDDQKRDYLSKQKKIFILGIVKKTLKVKSCINEDFIQARKQFKKENGYKENPAPFINKNIKTSSLIQKRQAYLKKVNQFKRSNTVQNVL